MKKIFSLMGALVMGFPFFASAQLLDTIPFWKLQNSTWITTQPVPPGVVQATRSLREKLLADPYRPGYHFNVPEDRGIPGDPNGAFFANGRYHLMYLYHREGRGFSWGHVSSKDLLHWRHHPDAIVPTGNEDGIFSGGAFLDDDGKAVLSYWQVVSLKEEERFADRIATSGPSGIGIAISKDSHYDAWHKPTYNPVIASTDWGITELTGDRGESVVLGSADPSNIWKAKGYYYMLTGNLLVLNKYGRAAGALPQHQGDHLYLFRSADLKDWEYRGEFYDRRDEWTDISEDNMCPSFFPLPASADGGALSGKHLLLFISHNKGAQYYTGTLHDEKFNAETHGRMSWVDNAYFAPEALVDDQGRQIMWSWVFDDRPDSVKTASGWTGTYGLPRTLWLGKDGTLSQAPIQELAALRQAMVEKSNLTVNDGEEIPLEGFGNEMMEVEVVVDLNGATEFGAKVNCSGDGREETLIFYDHNEKTLNVDTRNASLGYGRKTIESGPFELKDKLLTLRIFVDRSIVEVFANDKQAIARTIYPTLSGNQLKLFANGGNAKVKSVKAWELMPANPY